MTIASAAFAGLQRLHRLFDAVEEVVAADQRLEALAREAPLRAQRFEPREGDVHPSGAQPPHQRGEHRCAGVSISTTALASITSSRTSAARYASISDWIA